MDVLSQISAPLLRWYDRAARVLPWREHPTAYRVWISEIMLQQTRVEAVKPYFERFLAALPDVHALAEVPEPVVADAELDVGEVAVAVGQKDIDLVSELPDHLRPLVAAAVIDYRQREAALPCEAERRAYSGQIVGRGHEIEVVHPLPLQTQKGARQLLLRERRPAPSGDRPVLAVAAPEIAMGKEDRPRPPLP